MYPAEPLLVRSPGRINLIGEHTDYNDGFVMPAAIDHATVFAVAESHDQRSSVYALKYDELFDIDLRDPKRIESPKWANYLLGVIRQFLDHGHTLKPFHCVFGGNIPMGAGLSSSASMECGFAFALNELNQLNIPKETLIRMAQWSEHHYVGVKCGIMDQFATMMGAEGQVIVLDCRSLEYHYSPLALHDHALVLCDTRVKHSLVDSEYNTRRSECERGVAILQRHYPQVKSLRDATPAMVEKHRGEMTGKVYDRCLYVVQEIERVQLASQDLKANRLEAFGKKMFETHEGLSKRYEVSCKELDFLVDRAKDLQGVLGARMMGGGFGGCTINLVEKKTVPAFIESLSAAYEKQFGHSMAAYIIDVKDGTNIISQSRESITLP
jgi:galactokinase